MTVRIEISNKSNETEVEVCIIDHLKHSPNLGVGKSIKILKPLETQTYYVHARVSVLVSEKEKENNNND